MPIKLNKSVFFLQKTLLDFVNIEMIFHAKALEIYSECLK